MADFELLIHTSDTFSYDTNKASVSPAMIELDKTSNMKQGFLQAVKPVGSPWGYKELDTKRFLRVIIPSNQYNPNWLLPDIRNGIEYGDRLWRFDLRKILTASEYETLINTPYNSPINKTPILKGFDSAKMGPVLTDWAKQPAIIKLHGSAGDFTVIEDGTGDYTSLKTAIETEAADISAGAVDANFYISKAWTGVDTGNWDIDGWTMGTNNMLIQTQGAARSSDGQYLATGHRIENTTQIFDIENNNVTIDGIQCTGTGLGILSSTAVGNILLDSCIIKILSGNGQGVQVGNSGTGTYTINNCVIYKTYTSSTTSYGVRAISSVSDALNVYNCTISGFYRGVRNESSQIVTVKNSAIFNNDDDFVGTLTVDYCASDDGDGTNSVDISPGTESTDWGNAFIDYANGDFSVKDASSVLYNAGTDLSGSGVTDDIIGTVRPQSTSYDIGAFEFIVAGGVNAPTGNINGPLKGMFGGVI